MSTSSLSLHLAAVERHLRNDEESSVDTGADSSFRQDLSGDSSSPEKDMGRRKRLDSIEGRCSTPPQLRRRHHSSRGQLHVSVTSEVSTPPSPVHEGSICMPSPEKPAPPAEENFNTGSRMGMSVFLRQIIGGGDDEQRRDDTLSLSSDSALDSDQELERRAWEIREDLRVSQLIEIAAVAERAAAAGHASFTGLASTFGRAKGEELAPLEMHRNNTYTEGLQQLTTPVKRPYLLRRTQTTGGRRKRKIPVMALRHIDDLIPPMNQLHLHLRSHLYRSGVETENSVVDEPVEYGLMEKKRGVREGNNAGSTSDVSFIQQMKRWVSTSSPHDKGKKKLTDAASEYKGEELSPSHVDDFVAGDRLCEQITIAEIASGGWKPSPVEVPAGLILPDEQQFIYDFLAHPNQKQSSSPGDKADQKTIETEPTSSSSENGEESQPSPQLPRALPEACLTPVALFNADEDIELDSKLGSRHHPKPFEVLLKAGNEVPTPVKCLARRSSTDPSSPNNIPNMYITPVRLKGIRGRKSNGRGHFAWAYSPGDSFRSEPGVTPLAGERRGESFTSVESAELSKSDGNLFMGLSEGMTGKSKSFLKPRSTSVSQIIESIKIDITQATGESTHDPSDPSNEMKSCDTTDVDASLVLNEPTTVAPEPEVNISPWLNSATLTPERSMKPGFETSRGTPERLTKAQRVAQFKESQSDSLQTPAPGCECVAMSQMAMMHSESTSTLPLHESKLLAKAESDVNQEPATPTLGFRRTTSCPSLVDTFEDLGRLSPSVLKTGTKKSILNVFQRLSPKSNRPSERNLYYTAGDNHEYLNNYLYCGKPGQEKKNEEHLAAPALRPFCGQTDGVPCVSTVSEGCDALNTVTETATSLFKSKTRGKDSEVALIFETQSSSDFSGFAEAPETWFAAASERFDGALERLVGSENRNNTKWKKYFEAPTLNIKTPQSDRKTRSNSLVSAEKDPRKVQGIILVPHGRTLFPTEDDPKTPSISRLTLQDTDSPGEVFASMYGISRIEFYALSKDERVALWQRHQERMVIDLPSLGVPAPFLDGDTSSSDHSPA